MDEKIKEKVKSVCNDYTDEPKVATKGGLEVAIGAFCVILGGAFFKKGIKRLLARKRTTNERD